MSATAICCESVAISYSPSTLQVKVISNSTTLIADAANKEDISMRVKQIKKELSETDSVYDTEKLSERIAKLAGGVAVIKVLFCYTAADDYHSHYSLFDAINCSTHKQLCYSCIIKCMSCVNTSGIACFALTCEHQEDLAGHTCHDPSAPRDCDQLATLQHRYIGFKSFRTRTQDGVWYS